MLRFFLVYNSLHLRVTVHWHVPESQSQGIKLDFIGSFSVTTAANSAKMVFFLDSYENRQKRNPDPDHTYLENIGIV